MSSAIEQELRQLVHDQGRITFAQFMQTCLYSPRGGFYSSRADRITKHFTTSPTMHPVFGELLAVQMEQMWHLLGKPSPFHIVEVGSGDGSLARSIVDAARGMSDGFPQALKYVATDYDPWWPAGASAAAGPAARIQRVRAEALGPFGKVVGCILCNELIDNFPVHRFVIKGGKVLESFVGVDGDRFIEVLGAPSTPRIEERLIGLGVALPEGARGEVNLAVEDWAAQVVATLERGFVLTIDYGELAKDLYSDRFPEGGLVCYREHNVSADPYERVGEQDITLLVDFSSVMRAGERRGLLTLGYGLQADFLENLGLSEMVEALDPEEFSDARTQLARMAMMALVDPDDMGDFKVLAQGKDIGGATELRGFKNS